MAAMQLLLSMAGIVCLVCRNCEQCWVCKVCWEFISYVIADECGRYGLSFMWKAVE